MAYSGTKIETWNRSTPRDGLLLDSEFSQLYDDIENYISGNSGAEPPYTLKELADGTVTFAGAKTFSSKITGSISGDCDGNAGTVTGGVYTSGNQTIAGVKTFSSTIVGSIDSIKETGEAAGTVRKRIIEIGDWNMSTLTNVNIPHGLTLSKIIAVNILIRDDSGNLYPLTHQTSAAEYDLSNGWYQIGATYVLMFIRSSGWFGAYGYSSTSYNRGWITIEYVD